VTHFTTREVARILELPEARIRSCVRAGLVAPSHEAGRQLQFTFQDLLLLKTTKDLLDARVPVERIRRMVASLRRQLPDEQSLSGLTIYADGRRIVAWDGNARWQPDSGQFLFNFDVEDVVRRVSTPARRPPARRALPSTPALTAEEWLDVASALEADSPDEARQAYHQVLDLDPTNAEAHVNVGRLYHQAKDYPRAQVHYKAAIEQAPEDAVAHFNLGVLFEDLGRRADAVASYRRAIAHDSEFADAHYNLGLIFDGLGRRTEAITHLKAARRLYGRSGTMRNHR
jgi:tetratricopeptide (TPR) repeat protein